MNNKTMKFVVPQKYDNSDAKTFLRHYCGLSARMIKSLKQENMGITRNNQLLKTNDVLKAGDMVILKLPADNNEIVPVQGKISILYEDESIIALDKPYNMPVHPTKVHQLDTLANRVVYYAKSIGENYSIRIINRLDSDTTGVVVIAKDRFTAFTLPKTIEKVYTAVCCGVICESGTIDMPIKIMQGQTIQRIVATDGAKSVTHYKPLKHNEKYTILSIVLETGRTHQIRCHFNHIGHPLAGDDMYGGKIDDITRQALHCSEIQFVHPTTGKIVKISSQLPDDMQNLL